MTKSLVQKLALLALIALIVAGSVHVAQNTSGSPTAYNIPRMVGAGEADETIRLNGAPTTGIEGPFMETTAAPVVMDRDLRDLPQSDSSEKQPMREMGKFTRDRVTSGPDPVIQTDSSLSGRPLGPLSPAPAPLMNFKGQSLGSGWPPDTHGDVGPNYYVQAVNTSIGIFDKTTGSKLAGFTFNAFFSTNGAADVCATSNRGDPVVLYDQISGRWIITDFAWVNIMNGPYYECIAVSKTANPISGGWYLYTFRADDDAHAWLNDYPKLGIWSNGIYMTANLFDCLDAGCNNASYEGARVWALNRDDMISGAPLHSVSFLLGTLYGSLLPANLKGALPPSDTPEYFMADDIATEKMDVWKFTTNWASPASSTFTGPQLVAIAPYNLPSINVPQLNSSEGLDSLGDRLMSWLQYRNIGGTESLWVSRTVNSGGNILGVRWMEIRNMKTTPIKYQQGTYAPDSNHRWMPSLAVNKQGDMAIGYSVSSSSMYPAIRYAGRLVSDPLDTLGQTETTLFAGTGSQSGGYTRWGDYSSMSVDPVDDCTFWYTTEYYETTGSNWQTRIGSFQLPGCVASDTPPSISITSPVNNATVSNTVNIAASTQDDNGVTQVEFFVDGNSLGTDSNGADGWSMSWDTSTSTDGLHTISATATDTIGQTNSDSKSVTVTSVILPSIHVGDLDGIQQIRRSNWRAVITIVVHDNNHKPMRRVTVNFTWSGGYNYSASCRTGFSGLCKVRTPLISIAYPMVTLNVTNLTLTGYIYDPSQNHDPDGGSDGTTITILP